MAENEFYHLDLVVSATGIEGATQQLRTMDKFIDQTRKRGQTLNRVKMSPMARLIDRVSGPAKKVNSMLSNMSRKTWMVTIRAKDFVFGVVSRIKNALFSLPTMLGIGIGAAGGIFAPLKLAGDMEQAGIAFETMLGSAQKATGFLEDLRNFANKTPFEFPELRDSSKRMLAFGFASEKILPMLTGIGNAASGLSLGGEGISRISTALGQMKAKAKVSGEEMLQLTEAGIPAWDILAKKMNISTAQVMKMSEKGLIPADKAIDALIDGMNEKFPNMMAKQSKSLFGFWSTLKDTFNNNLLVRWGDGIRSAIQPRFEKLVSWIDNNEKTIQRWGDNLQRTASKATDWMATKVESVIQLFNDPAFKNASFFGKVKISWDEIVATPFAEWWASGGEGKILSISQKMGSGIGKTLSGAIMGAFGLLSPDEISEENVFLKAGSTAGKAFFDSFVASFDAGAIAKKLGKTTWEVNKNAVVNAVTNPSVATATGLAVTAGVTAFFAKKFGAFRAGKGLWNVGKKVFGKNGVPTVPSTSASTITKSVIPEGPFSPTLGPRKPPTPSSLSKLWKIGGKAALPVTLGVEALNIATSDNKPKAAVTAAGGLAGMWSGATAGAAMGSVFPGPGTAIGGFVGGIGGYMGGQYLLGRELSRNVGSDVPAGSIANRLNMGNVVQPLYPNSINSEQLVGLEGFLQSYKPQREMNISVPTNVNVSMPKDDIDYDALALQVGWKIVNQIRREIENSP